MNTHHIRREYSSEARGRARALLKTFKAYFETFIERGRGANLSKIKPINQKKKL